LILCYSVFAFGGKGNKDRNSSVLLLSLLPLPFSVVYFASISKRRVCSSSTLSVLAMGESEVTRSKSKRKSTDIWRKYGAARRKELVAKDETQGGTRFEMSKKCQIEAYFRVAEKTMSDFQKKCEDPASNLEETYVMGHRLKAFLGQALPQHPHYKRIQVAQLRSKSLRNLAWIKEKMHDLALKIDEDQLNTYITMDFEPEPDDISTSSSEPDFEDDDDESSAFADFSSMGSVDDQEWHAFAGWGSSHFSQCPQKAAPLVDSTESESSSQGPEISSSVDESDSEDEQPSDELINLSELDNEIEDEPQAYVTFQDDDDDDSQKSDGKSEFLRKIADEDVCYESDSEAVDSWAQEDSESHAQSCASSGSALTYDPARIAFREIMINIPKDHKLLYTRTNNNTPRQTPPPPAPALVSQLPQTSILTLKRRMNRRQMAHWASMRKAAATGKRSS